MKKLSISETRQFFCGKDYKKVLHKALDSLSVGESIFLEESDWNYSLSSIPSYSVYNRYKKTSKTFKCKDMGKKRRWLFIRTK